MISFTIAALVVLSSSSAIPSEILSSTVPTKIRCSARLLDAETQAKVQALDARIKELAPSSTQRALQVVSLVSLGLVIIPAVAIVGCAIAGMFLGAAAYGFPGAVLGMAAFGIAAVQWIPPALWVAIAVVAAVGAGTFVAEVLIGAQRRAEVDELRRERRALTRGAPRAALAPTQLVTVASF